MYKKPSKMTIPALEEEYGNLYETISNILKFNVIDLNRLLDLEVELYKLGGK